MSSRIGRIGDWNNADNSNSSSRSSSSRGIRTFRDLNANNPAPRRHGHGHDDDDDDEEDSDRENRERTTYAGGERSGLSIQDPNSNRPAGRNIVDDLLRRAAAGGPPPEPRPRTGGAFSGGGHTLGSDDVDSTFVPDPNAAEEEQETAIRRIILWADGFSIEDGPLMRYDEPGNAAILSQITDGTAPLHLLNVRLNQPVELRVEKRTGEKYVPPARPAQRAFSGEGHRLGAPVPSEPAEQAVPGSFPSTSASTAQPSSSGAAKAFEVDHSAPTTSVQVRLADGTRMVLRMNLTHTVGDIRNLINASNPQYLQRPYTIGTTFPNRTLSNDEETVQAAGISGSVVVQRWV